VDEIIQLIIKSYGLIGLFLILPLLACYFLWKENKRITQQLQDIHEDAARKIQACNDRIIEAHKIRVTDAQAVSSRVMELSSEQTSGNKEYISALDRLTSIINEKAIHRR
jgi:hypothetical protein